VKPIRVDNPDPLLAPREAAALLAVKSPTVAKYRRERRLKAVRLPSGRYHYRTSVVVAFRDAPRRRRAA